MTLVAMHKVEGDFKMLQATAKMWEKALNRAEFNLSSYKKEVSY
jgi:hypothetical protein